MTLRPTMHVTAWLLVLCLTSSTAVAQQLQMYWSDRIADTISVSDLDGNNVRVIQSGLGEPRGIDVDFENGMLYWADNGTNKIQRSRLDGSQIEDLVTSGLNFPAGIVLDVPNGKMYWADAANRRIQRSNLDGSQVENLVTGLSNPYFITLDPLREHLYWSDYGTDKIQRSNLDGTNVVDVITTGLNTTRGVALDLRNDMLYWADRGTDLIQRSRIDGSEVETLVVIDEPGVDPAPHGVAVDAQRGKLYWVDNGTVKIQRSNLDGTDVEDVMTQSTALTKPWQIVLDLNIEVCDFDRSGLCDARDMDLLSHEIRAGTHRAHFNLNRNQDSVVDTQDRQLWLELANVQSGDANLDGRINGADLSAWQDHRFVMDTGWATGDFNGDGSTDGRDFNLWLVGRTVSDAAAQPVPEPSGIFLTFLVTFVSWAVTRER